MKLYYHKDTKGNFGDDLNPFIWRHYFPNLIDGEIYHEPKIRQPIAPDDVLLIGIGTLLNEHIPANIKKYIFGSGMGYGADPSVDKSWEFICVRGPLTANKLNLDSALAITDPAILLPDVRPRTSLSEGKVGFIPHCSTADVNIWEKLSGEVGLLYISPRQDSQRFLELLWKCDWVITEAMHGAIVADAYRIPWVSVKTHQEVLEFKWMDWCESLKLIYRPEKLPSFWQVAEQENIGLRKRFIRRIKIKQTMALLQKLRYEQNVQLSHEEIYRSKQDRLLSKVDWLQRNLSNA